MTLTPPRSSVPLSSVPRGWVSFAAVALALAAILGTGLGVARSLGAHDAPSDTGELSPVPNTTLAKALPADLDEGRMRTIAREEAQAVLTRSAQKPKAAPKDDDASDTPADNADAVSTVTSRSTAVTPSSTTTSPTPRSPSAATNPYPPGVTPN